MDAVVDRYVSSGISGAQRCKSSWYLLETEYYVYRLFFCQSDIAALIEHVCVSYLFCFFYLSIPITFLALDFYIEHACALVVVYACFYFTALCVRLRNILIATAATSSQE